MKTMLALSLAIWGVACATYPSAAEKAHDNRDALIEQHKIAIKYGESEQYKTAKHANEFIATAYGRE